MDNFIKRTYYTAVAADYSSFWFYETGTPYEQWKLAQVTTLLNLQSEDRLCDLGGGTGHFSAQLSALVSLKNKVWVVEPCEAFVKQARLLANIEVIDADAKTFITTYKGNIFDKILLKEVVHHFSTADLFTVFQGLRAQLRPNGQLLIITRPKDASHFPFFKKALEEWAKEQQAANLYCKVLRQAGFSKISTKVLSFPIQMARSTWYQLLRQRFWSNLAPFSDAEIAAGIQEIEQVYPSAEPLQFEDKSVFILAGY